MPCKGEKALPAHNALLMNIQVLGLGEVAAKCIGLSNLAVSCCSLGSLVFARTGSACFQLPNGEMISSEAPVSK